METPSLGRKAGTLPFVSVVVPIYNDAERLFGCLQALEQQSYPRSEYEVIVVDNNSDEDIGGMMAPFEQARLVYEGQQGSYAARNRGVLQARGEVLAFTDADCVPERDWLSKGVERLLADERCGLVGGKVVFTYRNPDRPSAAELYDSSHYLDQERYIRQGSYAATANAFTFRRVFEEAGLFDASLKSGGDTEWGRRVAAHGYRLCYAEEAQVRHPARHSFRALREKILRVQEGTLREKLKEGYPFRELSLDMAKVFGHQIKFALRTAHEHRLQDLSGGFAMFIAFPYQGLLCALKRLQLWMRSPSGEKQ